jgi:ATP-dependent DNA helicase PIF1
MNLSPEQRDIEARIIAGENMLITGSAGTGKSTLLKSLTDRFNGDLPVAASTGIAAVNVGGMTINSWAGLGLADSPAEKIAKELLSSRRPATKRILKAKRLAIDEVSMIGGDLFEITDKVFRIVRKRDEPFGGVQLILFGDFLQLPPVAKKKEQRFAFESDAWRAARISVGMLTHVFRQSDQVFASALNQIRVGELTPDVRRLLRSRYRVPDPSPDTMPVIVYTHNADVDAMNNDKLDELPGRPAEFQCTEWGEPGPLSVLQKNCLAPETLRLKPGAQVMLLKNLDPMNGLANGSIGKVLKVSDIGTPIVSFPAYGEVAVEKASWEIKSGDDILAQRTQYPLRLAWAITAHKSQGMTLDKISVHLARAFEYGQSYVALSRARTLGGLFIESTAEGCIKAHPRAVQFYRDHVGGTREVRSFATASQPALF